MPRKLLAYLSVIALFFAFCWAPYAAADWSWNPFSKSTASASRNASPLYTTQPKKSSWMPTLKAPKMPWSSSGSNVSSYSKNKTSTWNKMSKSSKKWWNKTAEMLDPYPEPKPSTYASSYGNEKKKSSWFGSMGSMFKKEPAPIETVPDFLRQESPH